MWTQDPGDRVTWEQGIANVNDLNTEVFADHSDWRVPTVKELYSLILFNGDDVSSADYSETADAIPFIDINYFEFEYGEPPFRVIDAQYVSSTEYESTVMYGEEAFFGVNFADGRIKAYGKNSPTPQFLAHYVRGNENYGVNDFSSDGDVIIDASTGLQWMRIDSGSEMIWTDALAYCEDLQYGGHDDWRLPNAKELHSIVDYSRSPDTTSSAAIDEIFEATTIENESGENDFPWYWTSTTHKAFVSTSLGFAAPPGRSSVYISFGRSLGNYLNDGNWIDVHGAGSQRSDPKTGDPAEYEEGWGPQGDAVRIYNYVRCVREGGLTLVDGSTTSAIVNPTGDLETPTGGNPDETTPPQTNGDDGSLFGYHIVDTGQAEAYSDCCPISISDTGESYYGQDAQYYGNQPTYVDNGDGTITDTVTGLMWTQDPGDRVTWEQGIANVNDLNTEVFADHSDWRVPTVKELYSLILFNGDDVSSADYSETADAIPFIDINYFEFEYGEPPFRVIDAQYVSSTEYESTVMYGEEAFFGVNFADGRIKAYGKNSPTPQFLAHYVRGNENYGVNDFSSDGDVIIDASTGLQWMRIDSGSEMIWTDALAYCEDLQYGGHDDWRLPNAKELHSIVDYSRSPDTTSSAAIDEIFEATTIENESGENDFPWYWTSTTHKAFVSTSLGFAAPPGRSSVYISFGRSLGNYLNDGNWIDVHGAGSQRSDPKTGDPAEYEEGWGPQGDAVRIYNYVRCVREGGLTLVDVNSTSDIVNPTGDLEPPIGGNPGNGTVPPQMNDDGEGIPPGDGSSEEDNTSGDEETDNEAIENSDDTNTEQTSISIGKKARLARVNIIGLMAALFFLLSPKFCG